MALEVKIKKRFERFQLDVSLEAEGGFTGLLGTSGCGKSVTLRCIAGILTPDEGRIVLDGKILFDHKKHINLPPQERRVGYLFQNYALFPNMTAAQNIAAGIRERGRTTREKMVQSMVRSFRLEGLEHKYPHQLSGGQQQRVALARILAGNPSVLLLDEPFSALDDYLKWQVELELGDLLADFPGPTLFVTHSRDEVYRLCRKVCVLDCGCSEPIQSVRELFDTPSTRSACILSGCKNVSRAYGAGDGRIEAPDWGVTLETGREIPNDLAYIGIRAHYLTPVSAPGPNVTECRVERVVENPFSTVVMLAGPGSSSLRMELSKESWAALKSPDKLHLFFPPESIMLLR